MTPLLNDMTQHDHSISIAKGLLIILMVIGHSGCPETLNHWIYLFHMPAFFFISGYLFKIKNTDNLRHYTAKKIKTLWWPFVKYSIIFLLLHNIFTALNFYTSTISPHEILTTIPRILIMTDSEQLLGGYWFLKQLLYASILSTIILKLWYKLPNVKLTYTGGAILPLLFVIAATVQTYIPYNIPTISNLTYLATAFYLAGYFYSQSNLNKYLSRHSTTVTSTLAIALVIIAFFWQGSMSSRHLEVPLYYAIALGGTIMTISVSRLLSKTKLCPAIDYIGRNTLTILTYHFISFKAVSFLIVMTNDMPLSAIATFPTIASPNWWIVYSITGVMIPLTMSIANKYLKNKLSPKLKT